MTAPASALLRECLSVLPDSPTMGEWAWDELSGEDQERVQEVRRKVEAHLAAGSGEGWVSVQDGLPEIGVKVLVVFAANKHESVVRQGEYQKGCWFLPDYGWHYTVTHWQLLPPAPTGEK